MFREIKYIIDQPNSGISVEKYLRSLGYTGQSITDIKKMSESVLVGNVWVHMTHRLIEGDELVIRITETDVSENIVPVNLPFPVVYEDDDLVVVNKPAGMPIHPSLNNYDNSLANAAAHYYVNQGEEYVFRCINRLDRDTSGLTILAKHSVAAGILYKQME